MTAAVKTASGAAAPPIRYAMLIFPGFPLMAFSAVLEPLRAANLLSDRDLYRWTVVSNEPGGIRASNGLQVDPDFDAGAAPDVDRIVVCSGGDADHLTAEKALSWIRRQLRSGVQIGAVADAAFFLARAGLLNGYACTLHWTSRPAFREAFPEIDMRQDLYVIDRNRFTSTGGIGAMDMMLEVIEGDHGRDLSVAVAEWFSHVPLRDNVDRQRMPLRLRTGVRDELVLSAIAAMERTLDDPPEIGALARRFDVSRDRLERAFRRETGRPPSVYLRQLRLDHAADLLLHSTLQIDEVALACGFGSASGFSRAFRLAFGCTPREMRHQKVRHVRLDRPVLRTAGPDVED